MTAAATIEDRISDAYGDLSAKLRTAADYVAGHPVEVATRSLRSLAQTSGVSPATFSRLARALGVADYEEMREAGRAAGGAKLAPCSERARARRGDGGAADAADLLHRQAGACISNIAYLEQNTPAEKLEAAAEALHKAPKVLLLASLGSSGVLDAFEEAQVFTLPATSYLLDEPPAYSAPNLVALTLDAPDVSWAMAAADTLHHRGAHALLP